MTRLQISRSILHIGAAAAACTLFAAPLAAQTRPDFNGIWGGGVGPLTPTTCKTSIDAFPARAGDERFKAAGAQGTQQYITFEQDCAIAHRGQVTNKLKTSVGVRDMIGRGSGEAFQLELSGHGVVYVQASERKI